MSNLWIPRPSNAGTRPCRNDQNCYFLKHGHCWYYHPPHHHTYNQRRRDPQSTASNNPIDISSNPFSRPLLSRPNSSNPNPTNRNQNNNPNRGSNSNQTRRRNQRRLNQASSSNARNTTPSNSTSNPSSSDARDTTPPNNTSTPQPRTAPTIQSPANKRTRTDLEMFSSLSLNDSTDSSGDKDLVIEAFQCPISMEVMSDPVIAADGHSYDKMCIERWLRTNNRSPMNNTVLQNKKLLPNYTLKKCILEWNTLKSSISPMIKALRT